MTTAALGQGLSEREQQILVGLAAGRTNAEIGAPLFLAENTVKTYVRRILRKLGAPTRAAAVHRGVALGLLPSPTCSHGDELAQLRAKRNDRVQAVAQIRQQISGLPGIDLAARRAIQQILERAAAGA